MSNTHKNHSSESKLAKFKLFYEYDTTTDEVRENIKQRSS